MANEPPCWILDEHYKDTGKRDYSRCNPMCCTVICDLMKPCVIFEGSQIMNVKPKLVTLRDDLEKLLTQDVGIQELIHKITKKRSPNGSS